MATSPDDSKREQPSTYVVQDRSNQDEMTRLTLQDRMMTAGMGGPLAEQSDPTLLRRVLDVGCGTGGWIIETAKTYPTIERLTGVDISAKMVQYARAQVGNDAALAGRVEFAVMDALRKLEFPDESFDLVNERFGISYLRTWDWNNFLSECKRVCRPGGVIRFTESGLIATNSPAYNQLLGIYQQALYRSGHLLAEDSSDITAELSNQFARHGLENIQMKEYGLPLQSGHQNHELFLKDTAHGFRTALPFFKKWAKVPENYEEVYQQALRELQEPGFEGTWALHLIWGTTPVRTKDALYPNVP